MYHISTNTALPLYRRLPSVCAISCNIMKLCISPTQCICVLHMICITITVYLYRTNQLAFVM